MKTYRKLLTALFLSVVCALACFSLTACDMGGNSENNNENPVISIDGTYYLYENGNYSETNFFELQDGVWTTNEKLSGTYNVSGGGTVVFYDQDGNEFVSATVNDGVLIISFYDNIEVTYYMQGKAPAEEPDNPDNPDNPTDPVEPDTPKYEGIAVTFDANGGIFGNGETIMVFDRFEEGDFITANPSDPTRDYHEFWGWFYKNGENEEDWFIWDFDQNTLSGNITLYAVWQNIGGCELYTYGDGWTIDETTNTITGDVSSDGGTCDLESIFSISTGANYKLYSSSDYLPESEITNSTDALKFGVKNVIYARIYNENSNTQKDYTLNLYRTIVTKLTKRSIDDETYTNYYGIVEGIEIEGAQDVVIPEYCNGVKVTEIGRVSSWYGGSITADTENIKNLTIPKAVTKIYQDAFSGRYSNLENIYYGGDLSSWLKIDGLKELMHYHQVKNRNLYINGTVLSEVEIPSDITSIPERAFYRCNITSVKIPDNVTSIGNSAFYYCNKITEVVLGNGVQSIGEESFRYCRELLEITIPASVTDIEFDAFSGSGLAEVYNKSTNLEIEKWEDGEYNFYGAGVLNVYTQDGGSKLSNTDGFLVYTDDERSILIKYLGSEKEISLPEITEIRDFAFLRDDFTSITIPDSMKKLDNAMLGGFDCLEYLSIPYVGLSADDTENGKFTSIFGYNAQGNTVPKTLKTVVVRGGSNISERAFRNCGNIETITLPDTITNIGNSAFESCHSLKSINIPSSVTNIGVNILVNCSSLENLSTPFIGASVEDAKSLGYFDQGTGEFLSILPSLKHITFTGNTVVGAIGGYDLQSVTFTDNVKKIDVTFGDCYSLTTVTLPQSLTDITDNAFSGCDNLVEVCNKSTLKIEKNENGVYDFYGATPLNVYTNEQDRKLTKYDDGCVVYDGGIEKILVGYYGNAEAVTLQNGITKINPYVFHYGTRNITSIAIPDSVTMIETCAFYDCDTIETVTFGKDSKLKSIGYQAFGNCNNLSNIVIPSLVEVLGDGAFYGTKITEIVIPDNVKELNGTFTSCEQLTKVTIGSGVTLIKGHPFSGCTKLTTINYNGTVEEWKKNVHKKQSGGANSWASWSADIIADVTCTDGKVDLWGNTVQ